MVSETREISVCFFLIASVTEQRVQAKTFSKVICRFSAPEVPEKFYQKHAKEQENVHIYNELFRNIYIFSAVLSTR